MENLNVITVLELNGIMFNFVAIMPGGMLEEASAIDNWDDSETDPMIRVRLSTMICWHPKCKKCDRWREKLQIFSRAGIFSCPQ